MYNNLYMIDFDKLSSKNRKLKTTRNYFMDSLETITGLFFWNTPKEIVKPPMGYIENALITRGLVALTNKRGVFEFVKGSFAGCSGRYDLPTKFIAEFRDDMGNVDVQTLEIGKECVVCFNNLNIESDLSHLVRMSTMLSNTDISLDLLVKYTRATPIPIAENDNQKAEYEKALKDMREGKDSIIKSMMLSDTKLLDLSENKNANIQHLQDLSIYKDELFKWLFLPFGIVVDGKDKKAQINTKELDSLDQLAGINIYNRYICRKSFCDEVKDLFNIDIDVKLNPLFRDNDTNDDGIKDKEDIIPTNEEEREVLDNENIDNDK